MNEAGYVSLVVEAGVAGVQRLCHTRTLVRVRAILALRQDLRAALYEAEARVQRLA